MPAVARGGNRLLRLVASNWSVRGVMRYAGGLPIQSPTAQSYLNDRNFDPTKTLVFNPEAWVDPPAGTYGTSAPYYNDYRYQRRPKESASIACTFHVRERVRVDLRAEFFNIFNRPAVPDPTGTNAAVTARYNTVTGATIQGFGRIDTNAAQTGTPRSGQVVLRVSF